LLWHGHLARVPLYSAAIGVCRRYSNRVSEAMSLDAVSLTRLLFAAQSA
jgi:hypothetical protein